MIEEKQKQILNEVVSNFGKQEWFRDATIYVNHPETGCPTLEFKVNYIPIMERKNVVAFVQSKGLQYFFTTLDRDVNKA